MKPELNREESFGIERARTLTREAFETAEPPFPWFEALSLDQQAQAIEQAVRTITGQFGRVDREIGGKRSWKLFQDRLRAMRVYRSIEKFEKDWMGKYRFAYISTEHHNPLALVYVTMRDKLDSVAEAREKLTPPPKGQPKHSFNPGPATGATRHTNNTIGGKTRSARAWR